MLDAPLLIDEVVPLTDGQVGLAVLGSPIKHSISPQLHNAAIGELASRNPSFSNWVYHKIEVDAKNLGSALPHLAKCGYRGLNLTIPHKVEIFSIIDSIDNEAQNIGAVNTLWNNGSEWQGFNSDGYGLERALMGKLHISLSTANILILGAGGAARAAAAQALSRGCKTIWIGNRSSTRLNQMIKALADSFNIDCIVPFEISDIPGAVFEQESLVIINATSLGLNDGDLSPIILEDFPSSTKVYDMIYNPPETPLLKESRSMGMQSENGLSMLVYQAVRSLEIWTKEKVSAETMFSAARLAL
jgi:shikimate dehydrogenase